MLIEDPAVFTADWGVAAVLDGHPVTGVLSEPYHHAELGGPGMTSGKPTFWMSAHLLQGEATDKLLEVPEVKQGERVVVKGGTFKVLTPQPDGTGFVLLLMVRVRT